jgi:hypothetical protein
MQLVYKRIARWGGDNGGDGQPLFGVLIASQEERARMSSVLMTYPFHCASNYPLSGKVRSTRCAERKRPNIKTLIEWKKKKPWGALERLSWIDGVAAYTKPPMQTLKPASVGQRASMSTASVVSGRESLDSLGVNANGKE